MSPRPLLIAGTHVTTDDVRAVHSPFDGRVVAQVCWGTAEHLEAAIAGADLARSTMAALPAVDRAAILERARDLLSERLDTFVQAIVDEAGKPVSIARGEATRCLDTFTDAAWAARSALGEMVPVDAARGGVGRTGLVRRVPVGPVAAITPFNFPLNLVAHKLAPAIAAGCPVVLKPAGETPSAALLLGDLLLEAGLPAGALSILCLDHEHADALTTDKRLRFLSFTGSAKVGWMLKGQAVHMGVALELGGNAGTYVAADADLDLATTRILAGGFGYAGQTCISVQRVYVHRSVYPTLLEQVVARARDLPTGDPADEATVVGPVIRARDAERIVAWVDAARADGATVHCGGTADGQVVAPTVLTDVPETSKVMCDEVFGPVVSLVPVDSDDEALRRIDDSPYGLQAGLFTQDVGLVMKAWRELEVGGVMHNEVSSFRVDLMPYGGSKDSGIGREGPRHAVLELTEPRILVLNA